MSRIGAPVPRPSPPVGGLTATTHSCCAASARATRARWPSSTSGGVGRYLGPGTIDVPPGFVAAQGTVADAGTGGFTVATSGGTRVRVTRSTATVIGLIGQGTLSQLRVGETVVAIGSAEKDGSLAAMEVVQIPAGIDTAQFSVQSCSAESVDNAINTALTPGA